MSAAIPNSVQAGHVVWLLDNHLPPQRDQCNLQHNPNVNSVFLHVGFQRFYEFYPNKDKQEIPENLQQSLDWDQEPRRFHDLVEDQYPPDEPSKGLIRQLASQLVPAL